MLNGGCTASRAGDSAPEARPSKAGVPAPAAPARAAQIGNRLVANAAVNCFGQALLLALSFLATPFLIAHFGASRYGVLVLVLSLVNLLALFEMGFNTALVKHLAASIGQGRAEEAESYLSTGLALYLAIGAAVAIGVSLGAGWAATRFFHVPAWLAGEAVAGFELASVAFLLRFVGGVYNAVPIAAQRFDVVNGLFVGAEVVRIGGSVLVVYLGWLVRAVLAVNIFSNLLFLAGSMVAARRLLPGLRLWPRISRQRLLELLHFSKFSAVSQLASRIGNGLDGVVIAHLLPVAYVAFYVVPSALCFKIWALVGNVTSVTFPAASALSAASEPARLRELYLRGSKMVFALAGLPALALAVTSHRVLGEWINAEFARQGALALELLSCGVLVNCLMHVPDTLANGLGRPAIPAGFNVAETIVKFGLFFALIPRFGVAGAAAAYLAAQIVLAPWFVGTANRLVRVGWREWFDRVSRPVVVPLAGGLLSLALWRPHIRSLVSLVAALVSAAAIYALLGLFFILDGRERAACFALVERGGISEWAARPQPTSGGQS
jgi:O-antigen/teichoic acid export membrane protein